MKLSANLKTHAVAFAVTALLFPVAGQTIAARPASESKPPKAAAAKPKFGPEATLLSESHDYIRGKPAPDYWRLSPYYVGQATDSSCSVAAAAMIVNAARDAKKLASDEELATHAALLARTGDEAWAKDVAENGSGVPLDRLRELLQKALRAYGMKSAKVQAAHAGGDAQDFKRLVRRRLQENEKSAKNFLVANFSQGAYTGDADVGHFAPVGAYDEAKKQVLIMDPDRRWYEPYWVSEETFVRGMSTRDSKGSAWRGFLWIEIES